MRHEILTLASTENCAQRGKRIVIVWRGGACSNGQNTIAGPLCAVCRTFVKRK